MGFFKDDPKRQQRTQTTIPDYLSMREGDKIRVQLLSPNEVIYSHWLPTDGKRIPFRCLGEECPVCMRNLKVQDPDNDPDFVSTDVSYVWNVLDLMPVKRCPECETYNESSANICSNEECKADLVYVDTVPYENVRYLSGTWTLFKALESAADMLFSVDKIESEEELTQFPLEIKKVDGRTYPVFPQLDERGKYNPENYRDKLFDLPKVGIWLTPEEMTIVMNGGSFRDTMRARYAEEAENKKEDLNSILG